MSRPLRIGDPIPPFEARDAQGATRTEKDHVGRPFVLYFYPKDETPGCTAQGCAFRDAWDDFGELDVPVVGVSRDSPESHRAFAEHLKLPYTLLSDESGRMHRDFGARMMGGLPRRISYLVDAQGRVAAVYESHLRPAEHAARMLEAARAHLNPA